MEEQLYNYHAELCRVIDGDTIVVNLDLGMNVVIKDLRIRMARINAPEMSTKDGPSSLEFLDNYLEGRNIIVRTLSDKRDKYGRCLGEVFVKDNDNWINVNDIMVDNDKAKIYNGSIKKQLRAFRG